MHRTAIPAVLLACALSLSAAPALAQGAEAERRAVFSQMLADPSDRAALLRYARLSVELRDFEAAVATLERLLDLEPTNTAARLELGIAYFSLGAYEVAQFHLTAARAGHGLDPQAEARAARYMAEAADRGDGTDLSGHLALGAVQARPEGSAPEQFARVSGALDWRVDLGDANATLLVTELAFSAQQAQTPAAVPQSASLRLRVGPEYRVTGDAYGARLQPYLQASLLDSALAGDSNTLVSVGAAYQNPLSQDFTFSTDVSYGWGNGIGAGAADFTQTDLSAQLTYRPSRDTRIQASGWYTERIDSTGAPRETQARSGLRLSAQHAFTPNFSRAANPWVLSGFRGWQEVEITDTGGRDDTYLEDSLGVSLRAFIVDDIFLEASATVQTRAGPAAGSLSTGQTEIFGLSLGWEF